MQLTRQQRAMLADMGVIPDRHKALEQAARNKAKLAARIKVVQQGVAYAKKMEHYQHAKEIRGVPVDYKKIRKREKQRTVEHNKESRNKWLSGDTMDAKRLRRKPQTSLFRGGSSMGVIQHLNRVKLTQANLGVDNDE
jgi:hypothetical protein